MVELLLGLVAWLLVRLAISRPRHPRDRPRSIREPTPMDQASCGLYFGKAFGVVLVATS
jgi:hypothetical protein